MLSRKQVLRKTKVRRRKEDALYIVAAELTKRTAGISKVTSWNGGDEDCDVERRSALLAPKETTTNMRRSASCGDFVNRRRLFPQVQTTPAAKTDSDAAASQDPIRPRSSSDAKSHVPSWGARGLLNSSGHRKSNTVDIAILKSKSNRVVHFNPSIKLVLIPKREEFNEFDRFCLWWGRDDYSKFRQVLIDWKVTNAHRITPKDNILSINLSDLDVNEEDDLPTAEPTPQEPSPPEKPKVDTARFFEDEDRLPLTRRHSLPRHLQPVDMIGVHPNALVDSIVKSYSTPPIPTSVSNFGLTAVDNGYTAEFGSHHHGSRSIPGITPLSFRSRDSVEDFRKMQMLSSSA